MDDQGNLSLWIRTSPEVTFPRSGVASVSTWPWSAVGSPGSPPLCC